MTLQTLVRDTLGNDTLVASFAGTSIYPLRLPLGFNRTAIRYQVITSDRAQCLRGSTNLGHTLLQIDSYDADYERVWAMAGAVRACIEASTEFQKVFLTEQDLDEPEAKLCRVLTEFSIWRNDPAGSPA